MHIDSAQFVRTCCSQKCRFISKSEAPLPNSTHSFNLRGRRVVRGITRCKMLSFRRAVGAALRGGGNAAPSPLGGMLSALSSPASLSRDGGLTASVSGATSASLFAGAARRGFASSIPGGTPLDAITGRILALGQLWDNPGATHSVSAALGVPCAPA